MHGIKGKDRGDKYSAVLHYIRHPVDLLLSGYLYHKACQEPHWTNAKHRLSPWHLPKTVPVTGSYCKYLQKSSIRDGLAMEIERQLLGQDGLGIMLDNIHLLSRKAAASSKVLNICLPDAYRQLSIIEDFLRPWSKTKEHLTIPDIKTHHTDHDEQRAHYEVACELLGRRVPKSLLDTFPCQSSIAPVPSSNESISIRQRDLSQNSSGNISFEGFGDKSPKEKAFLASLDYSKSLGGKIF